MSARSTNIPSGTVIGPRQITNQFRNISLSREALDYLAQIGGKLCLEFSPESEFPVHFIADRKGNFLSTTREFEQLANYKSFITKKKEELQVDQNKDQQIALYKNLQVEYYRLHATQCPERMNEANVSKLGQLKKSVETTEKHLEVLESLPNSTERTYLLNQGRTYLKVLLRGMVECMGSAKYEQSSHDEFLIGTGVSKFIEGKFNDPNFTRDARSDAKLLVFPKGNFMKSVSFQTKEIARDSFLLANQAVITNSNSIIQLARSEELKDWFIHEGEHKAELSTQWEKFSWPMLAGGTVEDFLTPRKDRLNVKPFTATLAPKDKQGQKGYRPETAFQKLVRDLKNQHAMMMSLILDFYHLIPRVDSPVEDFWRFFTDTSNWTITPEKTIYHWIDEANNRVKLCGSITNNSNMLLRRSMVEIVGMHLEIPFSSNRFKSLKEIFDKTGENNERVVYNDDPPIVDAITLVGIEPKNVVDTSSITEQVRKEVNTFRGKVTLEIQQSDKSSSQIVGKKKLSKEANSHLRGIKDKELKLALEKWIRETFRNVAMQNLAAEFSANAVESEGLGYESEDEEESSEAED